MTSQTDQHGYKTKYAYDGGDRLTSVTDALGNVTKYAYDEVGNLTSVTDANGNTTRYTYDDFGRVVKTTNALGNSAYTTYDESGNVLTSTDFGGNTTTYTYDSFDRVSSKTTPDGTVSYTYTADGKISTVTDSTGTTTFTYNSMDGLTRVDYPDGNYVSYKYDKSNRLTKVSTAFGDTAYQYDLLDRITRVVDRNGYATVYEYDANGNRTAVKYANGLTVSYEYDKLNRLISEETIDNDSNIVVKYVYTLGASGERIKVEELDRTVEYTYDSLYRLTSETITKGKTKTTYAYEYDNVSNRTLKTVNGIDTVYTYNSLNQLVSENNTTYEYDNAGNLVRVVGAGKTALYVYNADNKLIKATVQQGNNVVVENYTYDYAGNRTSKTTTINNHVEKVYYLNDNSSLTNVLAELNVDGEVKVYYTIGADLISQEINGKVYVYIYDGHGTVRALANENGKVTDTYTYDAFGNLLNSTGTTANNYRYCGEQFDSTTGLYYLRARYMDTNTGRFISQDSYAGSTADPTSLHKYLYANSNPVMYSDPSGYFSLASVVCASTIGDMLFYSVSSGMIAFGMKLIRELRNVNAGLQVAVNWSEVIEETVIAMLMGGFFFCAGALAISLSSAAIFLALGGSCLIFFAMNCAAAQSDWESGNYDLAILEMIFAAGSVIGAKNCFDSAGACVAAKTTAATTTTPSTKNTTTANTNQRINDTKAKFQEAANQANKTVSGNGHVNGTKKHAAFKKIVDNFKNANYKTEISFLNGEVVKYGTKGSSRLDAVLLDEKGNIIAVFDLKTGNAKLSTSQIDKIHANLPEGAKDVPVIEIHPE